MAVAAALRPEDPQDREVLQRMLAAVRRECRAAGLHWVLAPVLDVNTNPANPIVGPRAFGEDPQQVASLGEAYVAGLQGAGPGDRLSLAACGKHFPGHGDAASDSHQTLPCIPWERERLERVALLPFRKAVTAGVGTIMVGHLQVPALDPAPVPATLSRRVVTGLLRQGLGFQGVVVSDAMDMAAVAQQGPAGETAARCLAAGVDVLLHPADPWSTLAGLQQALKRGRLSLERVQEAHRRLTRLKERLGLFLPQGRSPSRPSRILGATEHRVLAERIAVRAVTCRIREPGILPVSPSPAPALMVLDDDEPQNTADALIRAMASRDRPVRAVRTPSGPGFRKEDSLLILAVFSRVLGGKGHGGLKPENARAAQDAVRRFPKVVVVAFGNPYVLRLFPRAQACLAAYDTSEAAQKAVAQVLSGAVPCAGRAVFRLP